jgi:hypothetical protein
MLPPFLDISDSVSEKLSIIGSVPGGAIRSCDKINLCLYVGRDQSIWADWRKVVFRMVDFSFVVVPRSQA